MSDGDEKILIISQQLITRLDRSQPNYEILQLILINKYNSSFSGWKLLDRNPQHKDIYQFWDDRHPVCVEILDSRLAVTVRFVSIENGCRSRLVI